MVVLARTAWKRRSDTDPLSELTRCRRRCRKFRSDARQGAENFAATILLLGLAVDENLLACGHDLLAWRSADRRLCHSGDSRIPGTALSKMVRGQAVSDHRAVYASLPRSLPATPATTIKGSHKRPWAAAVGYEDHRHASVSRACVLLARNRLQRRPVAFSERTGAVA